MKEEQYFINKGNKCSPKIPTRFTNYLDKNNFLSEFQSEESKQNVKDNLGITSDLTTIKNLIDRKVIESGDIAWDLIPTEGNTENVLSSDSLYKEFLKYVTKEELDRLLQELYSNINTKIDDNEEDLEDKVSRLNNLYNSLERTLYNNIKRELEEDLEEKLYNLFNPYSTDVKELKQLVNSFLRSNGKNALSNSFGNEDYIGISQKTLTSAFNKIWEKINSITGEPDDGITMSVTPKYFVSEDGCTVHIKANTVNTKGIFEYLAFYVNGTLIEETENIDYFEKDIQIEETSVIKCVAKIMGIEYETQDIVTHYNSFWLGAGTTYSDVMKMENLIPINNGMRGAYDINCQDNDNIIIVLGEKLRSGFIRADMNGFEIPFEETSITVEGKNYKVLTSVNRYNAGIYNIDING